MIDLYFIRHAQSKGNERGNTRITGRSPEMFLSIWGYDQAHRLGQYLKLKEAHFDEIYSSPARRAMSTAGPLARALAYGEHKIIQSENLYEMSQGDWEGRLREEVYTPEVWNKMKRDPWKCKAPGGESQYDVEERMHGFFWDNFGDRLEDDLAVGIVSHHMAIKCFLRRAYSWDPRMTYKTNIDNTGITHLRYDEQGWNLFSLNDTRHL